MTDGLTVVVLIACAFSIGAALGGLVALWYLGGDPDGR